MILTVTWILRNIYQFQQIKSNPTHDAWLKVVSSQKVQNPIIILRLSTARTRDKSSLPLSGSVGRNVDDVDGKVVHTQRLEEILGLGVDLERRLLGSSKGRDLGDVLVLSLPLLFLQPERDTSDRTLLDSLHQMGGETSNLVPQPLGGNSGDLIKDSLVGVEVEGETGVVSLDEDSRRSLDGLCPDSTHDE